MMLFTLRDVTVVTIWPKLYFTINLKMSTLFKYYVIKIEQIELLWYVLNLNLAYSVGQGTTI